MKNKRTLQTVFLAALAARLAAAALTWSGGPQRGGDAADYHAYALGLVERATYVNAAGDRASRMPGYPLLLAAQYAALGRSPLLTQLWQSALGAAACALLAALAARWWPAPWPLTAGLMAALSMDLAAPCAQLLTEAPTAFFLALALWTLSDEHVWTPGRAALAGLPAAAAYLLRPEFGPWAALAIFNAARQRRWRVGAAAVAPTLAVALAWSARNAATLGRPLATTTAGPFNLYGWGLARTLEERLAGPRWERAPADASELEAADFYAARARHFFTSTRPTTIARAVLLNAAMLYYPFSPALDPTFVFIAPLTLLGLWAVRRDERRRALAWTLAYFTAVYCVAGVMIPRHRAGYAPATVLLAVAGLEWTRRRLPPRAFAAAVGCWAAVCAAAWAAGPWLRAAALVCRDRLLS